MNPQRSQRPTTTPHLLQQATTPGHDLNEKNPHLVHEDAIKSPVFEADSTPTRSAPPCDAGKPSIPLPKPCRGNGARRSGKYEGKRAGFWGEVLHFIHLLLPNAHQLACCCCCAFASVCLSRCFERHFLTALSRAAPGYYVVA